MVKYRKKKWWKELEVKGVWGEEYTLELDNEPKTDLAVQLEITKLLKKEGIAWKELTYRTPFNHGIPTTMTIGGSSVASLKETEAFTHTPKHIRALKEHTKRTRNAEVLLKFYNRKFHKKLKSVEEIAEEARIENEKHFNRFLKTSKGKKWLQKIASKSSTRKSEKQSAKKVKLKKVSHKKIKRKRSYV